MMFLDEISDVLASMDTKYPDMPTETRISLLESSSDDTLREVNGLYRYMNSTLYIKGNPDFLTPKDLVLYHCTLPDEGDSHWRISTRDSLGESQCYSNGAFAHLLADDTGNLYELENHVNKFGNCFYQVLDDPQITGLCEIRIEDTSLFTTPTTATKSSNKTLILGASVGAVVGLILIVCAIVLAYCLKKQKDRAERTDLEINKLTETINSVTRRDLTPLPSLPSRGLPSAFNESVISGQTFSTGSSNVYQIENTEIPPHPPTREGTYVRPASDTYTTPREESIQERENHQYEDLETYANLRHTNSENS